MTGSSRAIACCIAALSVSIRAAFAQAQPTHTGDAPPDPATIAKPDPARMSVADITSCMRANVVDRGSLREIEMVTTDREGKHRKIRMKLFWKPAKDPSVVRTTLRVVEPADQAGAAYLVVSNPDDDEVYIYMPALDRVQRVVGDDNQALFGTDFTQTDVKQVQALLEQGNTQRLGDAKVAERAVFVLDTATDVEETGYARIRSYVDQATCTLLKSEAFAKSGELLKVLDADLSTLISVKSWWLILGYTMRDLRARTQTALSLSDVYLLERLPEELFDPTSFYRVQP